MPRDAPAHGRRHIRAALLLLLPCVALAARVHPEPRAGHLALYEQEAFLLRVEAALFREPLLLGLPRPLSHGGEWRDAVHVLWGHLLQSSNAGIRTRSCNALLRMCSVLDPVMQSGAISLAASAANSCIYTTGPDLELLSSALPHLEGSASVLLRHFSPRRLLRRSGWKAVLPQAGAARLPELVGASESESVEAIRTASEEFVAHLPPHRVGTEVLLCSRTEAIWSDRALRLGRARVADDSGAARAVLLRVLCSVGVFSAIGKVSTEVAVGIGAYPTDEEVKGFVAGVPKALRQGCAARLRKLREVVTGVLEHTYEVRNVLSRMQERLRGPKHCMAAPYEIDAIARAVLPFTPSALMASASDLLLAVVCNSTAYAPEVLGQVAKSLATWAPERPTDHFLMPYILASHRRSENPGGGCTDTLDRLWRSRDSIARASAERLIAAGNAASFLS